ncbi:acyl carrier protein [Oribacterium sp. oral taxon 102]|uniref:acyl carrier protein n=1 Tax=Oribacterium sp. oral taxon 102 TaxID=671214 RepID=UPI0015C02B46|nr:acyl carrier protein [Oribacterium sp. oral taxon 102]NWO20876.1 acyl carrier protein [Oribacterium sp. oral taxon 102]
MVLDSVKKIVAERLDLPAEEITEDKTFAELGIDSLDTVELLMDLEDEIGMEIQLEEKLDTIGELVRFIESRQAEA